MRVSPIDLSGIGSLHAVARGAVDSETMTPPTTLSSPPPDLSMEKLPDNLDSESAVGTDSDAGIKDPMTPPTTLSSPPPMENLPGNHDNGSGVGTGSDAGNKDPMTPPTTLSSPPPMENLPGNHDNVSGAGTGSDAGNKVTMTPPTTLASPPPTIPMDYFLQHIVLVNETGGHTTHHHGNLATMMPTPIPIQMPPPYMSTGYLAGNLYHVDGSAVGTGFDAGNKAIMMPPPTPILNPPPYLPTGNLPDMYIVNGSAVGTVSPDKKGTLTQEKAVPLPRPKLLRVRSKFYIANPLVIQSKTVVGTAKQKTQTPQEAVLMPQQVLMVERDPRDANIFKEIPITEKGSALGTKKKKKVKLTSQKESKIDLDQHVKSGKHEVISSATGNFLMATTKTVRCTRREAKMNIKQRNDDYLLLRFLLNMGNLVMLIGFLNCMHDVIASIVNPEPRVATFLSVKFRFFIIWMVILHIFYSGTDLTLMFYYNNEKIRTGTRNVLPIMNKLKHLIDCLFRSILWPCSLLTSIFYWAMYTYDKMLTFPAFIGPAISWFVYEFFHTWLSLFVVMNMLCRPRIHPISFTRDLRVLYSFLFLYMIVFYYTVIVDGVWLDPCLASAYESGIFTFINLNILFLISCHTYYYALWRVNYFVHKRRLFFKNETSYFEIRWGSDAAKN